VIGAGGELHIADFGLPIVDWNSGIRNPKSTIRDHFSGLDATFTFAGRSSLSPIL
jgi:hypothetical protein